MSTPNYHDSYFREWINEPGVLADYLQHYLPPQVVAQVVPDSAQIVPGSFVDEQLRGQMTDLLCTVKLRETSTDDQGPPNVFVYCLIEHKSYPDVWVSFQLLRYMVQIWQQQVRDKATHLTPIVPMVLYHGEQAWRVPVQFGALFGHLGTNIGFVPQFDYWLTDLSALSEDQIHGNIITRVGLLGMKFSRNADLSAALVRIVGLLRGIKDRKLAHSQMLRLLKYVLWLSNNLQQADVQAAIAAGTSDPNEQEAIMSNFAIELIEIGEKRGIRIGEQRGIQIGEQLGIQATIARLIERKLGPLQVAERERIAQLSEENQLSLADALVDGLMVTYNDLVKRLALLNAS
ncbi:MAG: Rpn family recombination-promoting nuclease/putative transposase [Anaerolineae bacterium]|nr:Rpn family recombination-promoting nuclease/putative transposase [Anaerolineae bacterium]